VIRSNFWSVFDSRKRKVVLRKANYFLGFILHDDEKNSNYP
jgi:hypothetical protein